MEKPFAQSSENASFAEKLKNRVETLSLKVNQIQSEDQGKSIPEVAGKAKKIKGDKLPKVTNLLVESLDDRDTPVLGRLMIRMGAPTIPEI